MKISNDSKIRSVMYVITATMIICTIAGIIIFLLQIPDKEILLIINIFLVIVLAIKFINLGTVMYEDSGEVVTIKLFHPLENKLHCRTIEFPVKHLRDYGIKKSFRGYRMAITLESLRRKEVKCEFFLTGFGRQQLDSLIVSLEQNKQMNMQSFGLATNLR